MAATVSTPVGRAPVIPVVLIGVGGYLAWFAVHYWGSDTRWPTDPVKAVLQGKPIPGATGQQSAVLTAEQVESGVAYSNPTGPAGNAPAHAGAYDLASLQALWIAEGGAKSTAFIAANVAMAESSGDPK